MPTIDPALREALVARLRFYHDLGLTGFYRRPVDPTESLGAPRLDSETWDSDPVQQQFQENEPIPPRKPISAPPALTTEIKAADKLAALRLIQEDIGEKLADMARHRMRLAA